MYKARSETNLHERVASARLNSAVIQNSQLKYPITHQPVNRPSRPSSTTLKQLSPVYRFLGSKHSFVPCLHKIEGRQVEAERQANMVRDPVIDARKRDYERHEIKRQRVLVRYKSNLGELLDENKHFPRAFYKRYYRKIKEPFVSVEGRRVMQDTKPELSSHPVLNSILEQEQLSKKKSDSKHHLDKKYAEMKEEEQQEREYKKQAIDRFLAGEQHYFNRLDTIGHTGCKSFQHRLMLKDTYHFDNLEAPERQFTGYKDLRFEREQIFDLEEVQPEEPESDHDVVDHIIKPSGSLAEWPSIVMHDEAQLATQKPPTIDEATVREFWLNVRTNRKHKVQFSLTVEPALLDLIDRKGNSPLHWACLRNYTGIARMLISKKADFRMENHIGRTPKQYALQNKNTALLSQIRHIEIQEASLLNLLKQQELKKQKEEKPTEPQSD